MVSNWQEIRVRGKFLCLEDKDNQENMVTLSKWQYLVEISKPTHLIVGVHQEDERSQRGFIRIKG
jgi:hypothetical protein